MRLFWADIMPKTISILKRVKLNVVPRILYRRRVVRALFTGMAIDRFPVKY